MKKRLIVMVVFVSIGLITSALSEDQCRKNEPILRKIADRYCAKKFAEYGCVLLDRGVEMQYIENGLIMYLGVGMGRDTRYPYGCEALGCKILVRCSDGEIVKSEMLTF